MTSTSYDDLLTLFEDWRAFEQSNDRDGVPDYSVEAMARQQRELADYRARLEAIDPLGWPVEQRVDHQLVRAEMNGLDFDHRIRRPWAENPAFYVMIFPGRSDVPAHEGPVTHGWIDLWTYAYPLSSEDAAELTGRIATIPEALRRARENLTGNARDLWRMGSRAMEGQVADLDDLAARVGGTSAALDTAIREARDATADFAAWVEQQAATKTGPSGVGRENYTWYLRNVHLVPHSWEEIVTLMRRELWRAHSSLRLEEHRNRALPELDRIATSAEYDRELNDAVTEFMRFLGEEDVVTVRDYMDGALRERVGAFEPVSPPDALRGFFSEVDYRDPVTMRTHSYHWIELARMDNEPHPSPIRAVPPLFNIYDHRSEGLATAMEEMMMHAGLFDERPRARELIWILLAQRAARAMGGLMMHANEWTIDEAVAFASEWTPRGWLPEDGATVWGEQHLYLQQPGYGTSYLVGKIDIEQLISERAAQLGDAFTLRGFMDELAGVGVIPVSMARWQLVGQHEEIVR